MGERRVTDGTASEHRRVTDGTASEHRRVTDGTATTLDGKTDSQRGHVGYIGVWGMVGAVTRKLVGSILSQRREGGEPTEGGLGLIL